MALDKIIVVSMAKNEADIIESFVRYYMTFVDGMIIVDHNSDDDTGKILGELQSEYPSLIVDQFSSIEYIQAEVMTNLVKVAANELDADWILPFDIDEFLIPRDGADCRSIIGEITEDVISLNWMEHELVDTEHDRDVFLLNRLCNRSKTENAMTKIMVRGSFVRNQDVRLIQGQHGLIVKADNGAEHIVPSPRSFDFILAHFPYRSQGQYMSKNAVGWLTNVMKYSATTISAGGWKKAFDKIYDNDYAIPTIPESQFVGKLYSQNIQLKYTDSRPINVLSRVMKLAEKICDRYAIEKAIDKISPVTIIMPLSLDVDAAVDTIGSLLNQTLQKWELVIIAADDIDEEVKKALLTCDSRISIVGLNDDVTPKGFVKLVSPGRKFIPDCLEREAAALYIHKEFNINLTYSNSSDYPGVDVVADSFSARSGIDIWNAIKDTPYNLTGGVSGMLLRSVPQDLHLSEMIENYKWKEKDILKIILPQNLFLVFPTELL